MRNTAAEDLKNANVTEKLLPSNVLELIHNLDDQIDDMKKTLGIFEARRSYLMQRVLRASLYKESGYEIDIEEIKTDAFIPARLLRYMNVMLFNAIVKVDYEEAKKLLSPEGFSACYTTRHTSRVIVKRSTLPEVPCTEEEAECQT